MADPLLVLVHSPLVGRLTWAGVADELRGRGWAAGVPDLRGIDQAEPPYWQQCVERVAQHIPDDAEAIALVAHSGAGPLLPALGQRLAPRVSAYLFVDAIIPELGGRTPNVPPEFLDSLRALARDSWVPKWSQWWGEDVMADLVPDGDLRAQLESEMISLPLAYFEEEVPVPDSWPDAPCGYPSRWRSRPGRGAGRWNAYPVVTSMR